MPYVKNLLQNIRSGSPYFTIPHGKSLQYFMLIPAGDAKILYSISCPLEVHRVPLLDQKPAMAAIITDMVYLVNPLNFMTYDEQEEILSESDITLLETAMAERNRKIAQETFAEFYHALPVHETNASYEIRAKARRCLIYGIGDHKTDFIPRCPYTATAQDVSDELCGFRDLTKDAAARMQPDKEYWEKVKSETALLQNLIRNPSSVIAEWELRLAGCIRELDADTVTALFATENSEISIRIAPHVLLDHLEFDEPFTEYDPKSRKEGKALIELYKKAGIPEGRIRCDSVVKLSYKRKVLYEKYKA